MQDATKMASCSKQKPFNVEWRGATVDELRPIARLVPVLKAVSIFALLAVVAKKEVEKSLHKSITAKQHWSELEGQIAKKHDEARPNKRG
jgi:hypothetical protein